ncbi:MAG: peptidoglycan editing factor PgeF [Pseudohongiellaceae bacterium]|nr:peptidoglycan editing factor PgeF [Pseudohongiellaceae bacterium]
MDDGQMFIRPDWQLPPNITAFSTTRAGGESEPPFDSFNLAYHVGDADAHVRHNRHRLGGHLPAATSIQWLKQVHGTDIVIAQPDNEERVGDAIVLVKPGRAAAILTADCLPVLFASEDGQFAAAAHAGWRGLANGILEKTVAEMPCPADSVMAWLGPAIGACHFEVGAEVREQFLDQAEASHAAIDACFTASPKQGKYMADLYSIARIRLASAGVARVSGGGFCTYCESHRFYSYRREAVTGRMASIIAIAPRK